MGRLQTSAGSSVTTKDWGWSEGHHPKHRPQQCGHIPAVVCACRHVGGSSGLQYTKWPLGSSEHLLKPPKDAVFLLNM